MSVKATVNNLLLKYGFIRPDAVVQDASTNPAPSKTTVSLQAHDKQYHPNGWKPGDKCRLRDSIFNVDDLSTTTSGNKATQQKQGVPSQQQTQKNNSDFPTETEFENLIDLVKNNPRLVPPQLKQTLDDLPGEIFALAENQEYLDAAIADLPDGDAKNSLLADQQDLEDKRNDLRTKFLQTYRVLASILGTSKPIQLKRNPSLPHDPNQFPTSLDSTPTVNSDGSIDISFDGTSYHFTPCPNGSTGPVEGTININGQPKKFILKMSNKPGIRHAVPTEALKNEQAANEMLRKAGINAPDSKLFELNGNAYKLAEYIDNATPISQATITDDVREQLRSAYPLMDLMYSTDLMKDDNVRIDQNGKVWFVDNGSAFAFKGYGDKKSASNPKWKGFDFEQRNDANGPDLPGNDGKGGTKNYPSHFGALYESQPKIQAALGPMTQKEMLKEASRYNMSALVAGLPKESQCQALIDFAASLDKMAAKAAGLRKLKSSLKKTTSAQATSNQQQQTVSNTPIPQQISSIPQHVANALASGGVNLNYMNQVNGSSAWPPHWYIDNYPGSQNTVSSIGTSLPVGYSIGWYINNGNQGLVVCATPDKSKFQTNSSWPSGGFQGWADGGTNAIQQSASSTNQTTSASATSQSSSGASQSTSTVPMTNVSGGSIPSVAHNLVTGVGANAMVGTHSSFSNGYMYTTGMSSTNAKNIAQQLANQLGHLGYTAFVYGQHGPTNVGLGKLVNGATIPSGWGATVVQPQTTTQQPSQQQTASQTTSTAQSGSTVPNSLTSNKIPPTISQLLQSAGVQGQGMQISGSSPASNLYDIMLPGAASNTHALQTIANQLPSGLTLTTHGNGNAYIVNTTDFTNYWSKYNHTVYKPSNATAAPATTQQGSQPSTQTVTSATNQQSSPTASGLSSQPTVAPTSSSSPNPTISIPSNVINSLVQNGIGSKAYYSSGSNGPFYCLGAVSQSAAQNVANTLPSNLVMTKAPSGSYHIIDSTNVQKWTAFGSTVVPPTQQANSSGQASPGTPSPTNQPSQSTSPAVTTSTPASQPKQASPSSATSTKTYSYGQAGSAVKNNGLTDANIATDISNLVSGNNWQTKSGKQLIAPGTKLKTQGSLANNGDFYIGFPRGVQSSDISNLASQLNNEYQQYGYSVYAMGSWISVEKTPTIKMGSAARKVGSQTATLNAAVAQKQNATPARTVPPQTSPSATTQQTSVTPPPSSTISPVSTTQPSQQQTTSTPVSQSLSTPVTTSGSGSPVGGVSTQSQTPTRRTLSQMLQQKLASSSPQQQARFQAALNRANGNSGLNPIQTTPQSPQQSATSTSSGTLLTAPKSGNQPTPAQQQTINRFNKLIQSASPSQKAAFQHALSRYFGSI